MARKGKAKKRKTAEKCRGVVRTFLHRFSAAGIARIQGSASPRRRVAWCFMVLATVALMTYMTYKVIHEYFEYKKTVETTRVMLSSMKFPAVTICSPVTILRSRADTAGVQHLVRLEDFLSGVKKDPHSKANRADCNDNPACTWIWFEDRCACLANPCESEYCDRGYPLCLCSSLLCRYFNDTCFQVKDRADGIEEACYCNNNTKSGNRPDRTTEFPNSTNSALEELVDGEEVRDLLSTIRSSKIDDLSDVQWSFQPNIYNIANYGTSFDNLILGCSFQKKSCDKRNFTVLYTPTNGKCYSFNYSGGGSKQTEPIETRRFGWTSGLVLDLQIREDEVLNMLSKDIGVIVAVHDPAELPYVSEYGLAVRAGDAASLRVQRAQINRLGSPWGICLTSGSHLPFNYSDHPYSQLGCQRHCQNYYIKQKCNCVRRSLLPPSVKRPKNATGVNICNFHIPSERICSDAVIESIENETIHCNCHQACKEDIFYTSLTAGKLNKMFYQFVKAAKTLRKDEDEDGGYVTTFASNNSNILSLKVYYGTLTLENVTERASYSWETLIANIGGNLGFFMGLTLITFFEVAELFCDLVLFALRVK